FSKYRHPPEIIARIAASRRGKKASQETKIKQSQALKQLWATERGKSIIRSRRRTRTPELIRYIDSRSKPVMCVETAELFPSVREAGRFINQAHQNLITALKT